MPTLIKRRQKREYYYGGLFGLHAFAFLWLQHVLYPVQPVVHQFCYLTMISFYLNFFYYFLMFLIDKKIIKDSNISLQHTYFKFAYVISFVVFIMYYGMILVDRSLLKSGNFAMPMLLDFFLHGLNYLFNVLELAFLNRRENTDKINHITYLIFGICYFSFLQIIYNQYEIAVYPFVKNSNFFKLMGIFASALAFISLGDLTYQFIVNKNFRKIN